MPGGAMKARMVSWLARTHFGREALEEHAELSFLRARPTPRVWLGLGLVALSYLIGWPAVGLLALVAWHWHEPLIVAIGGPAAYALSHLVFMVGSWLAGSQYVILSLRWAVRKIIETVGGTGAPPSS